MNTFDVNHFEESLLDDFSWCSSMFSRSRQADSVWSECALTDESAGDFK